MLQVYTAARILNQWLVLLCERLWSPPLSILSFIIYFSRGFKVKGEGFQYLLVAVFFFFNMAGCEMAEICRKLIKFPINFILPYWAYCFNVGELQA